MSSKNIDGLIISKNGRNDGIRTHDLFHPKKALYQAELRPEQRLSTKYLRIIPRRRRGVKKNFFCWLVIAVNVH